MTTPQKVGFFEDDSGHRSSMRLMCFLSLIAAIVFGALTVSFSIESRRNIKNAEQYPPTNTEGIYITFGFLLAAFAPKAVQKFAEQAITSTSVNRQ